MQQKNAYTLIELMITVAVIGILSAIAVPKMGGLIAKSKHASVMGKLGAMRSALTIYYSDNDGMYPRLGESLSPKYIAEIPTIAVPRNNAKNVPQHIGSNQVFNYLDLSTQVTPIFTQDMTPPYVSQWVYAPPQDAFTWWSFAQKIQLLRIGCWHASPTKPGYLVE